MTVRKLIGDPHVLRPYVYALLMLVTGLAGGYWQGRQQMEKLVVDRNIQVDHVVTKDRIVTVTRTIEPDGTITERSTTEDKDTTEDHSQDRTVTTPVATARNDYSLGVRYRVSSLIDVASPGPQHLEAEVGRRLLGDFWITAGGGLTGLTVGVRYDF